MQKPARQQGLNTGLKQRPMKVMKNDYLFDGTGQDPEIEKLEDLLSGYRYAETDPPELPALNIIQPFERVSWRRRLGLVLTFGTAVVAAVMIAMYVNTTRVVPVPQPEVVATQEPTITNEQPTTTNVKPTVVRPEVIPVGASPSQKPRGQRANFVSRPKMPKATIAKRHQVILTEEERYAYNQVKLALFITGSKLRAVSDAVENKQVNSPKNNR